MFIVIFDKTGNTKLSGWHYEKLHDFDAEWIQNSAVKLDDAEEAIRFAEKLRDFGVERVKIFRACEFSDDL